MGRVTQIAWSVGGGRYAQEFSDFFVWGDSLGIPLPIFYLVLNREESGGHKKDV